MATLADIMTKVRRITRSPSASQLTDTDLKQYINDFLLYDFPELLRLFTFRTTFSFYTTPFVDVYSTITDATDPTNPMYDFKNLYITVHDPIYVAGRKAYFTQSRNDFYNIYPPVMARTQIGTGDGVTVLFADTLNNVPVIQNNVMFTSYDANYEAIVLKDIPQTDPVTGVPYLIGDLVEPDKTAASTVGTIYYNTGVYSLTFPVAPANGAPIYAQYIQYTAGMPTSILYFDNKFILRPIPDMAYKVEIETYKRPAILTDAIDEPILEQHFSFIAFGASKKIFEDRMDMESLNMIMPLLKEQELLCQRRTLVQQSNERVATIFTQQIDPASGWGWDNYR